MSNCKVVSIDGVDYIRKDSAPDLGPEVLIRSYGAGVHIGTLKSRSGQEVVLTNARRLWSWAGAFTLNAVCTTGVDRENSRISKPIPEITLTQAVEIIPVAANVDLSSTEK